MDPFGLCEEEHKYVIKQFTLCSPAAAFLRITLLGISAPGAPQAHAGFSADVTLWGNNHISQNVDFASRTLVNTTRPGHRYYPGDVTWQVEPGPFGVGSMITITGIGTGLHSVENIAVGHLFFGSAAAAVAAMCAAIPR